MHQVPGICKRRTAPLFNARSAISGGPESSPTPAVNQSPAGIIGASGSEMPHRAEERSRASPRPRSGRNATEWSNRSISPSRVLLALTSLESRLGLHIRLFNERQQDQFAHD